MFALIACAFAKRPLFFAPPLFGSHLHVTTNKPDVPWYCPKNLENKLMWLNEEYVLPPVLNCLATYITNEWDNTTHSPLNQSGVEVWAPDFGGFSSIRHVDAGILGLHIVVVFDKIISAFEEDGYKEKKDMFGLPYDWRNSPLYVPEFFQSTKKLIEEGYEANGQVKVALFSFSQGALTMYWFLTRCVDAEWKAKYIDRIVFGAPAFAGSYEALKIAHDQWHFKIPKALWTQPLQNFFTNAPVIGALLPNHFVAQDLPAVYGPNGEQIMSDKVPEWLYERGKVAGWRKEMMEQARAVFAADLPHPGVKTYILYNSAQETMVAFNYSNGWDKDATTINGKGDGTVPSQALLNVCDKWAQGGVVCHDINESGSGFNHMGMLTTKEFVTLVHYVMLNDDWVNHTGLTRVSGLNYRISGKKAEQS